MSCIDLLFCTNETTVSNHGIGVSILDKCHLNFIFAKVNIRVPLPQVIHPRSLELQSDKCGKC